MLSDGEQLQMIENWLNRNAPGYVSLNQEERDAIKNFSVLWSLFEAQVLDTKATPKTIKKKSNLLHTHGHLNPEEFQQFKDYFVARYIENGETNDRFEQLRVATTQKKPIELVLKGEENNIASVVEAMLIIVLRYRNNFFHGNKWAYDFNDQLNNFNTANKLLMKVIEINKY